MIKNFIFDFGKVLVCYDFPAFLKTLDMDEADRPAFEHLVCDPAFVERCDRGVETFSEIIQDLQRTYPRWHKPLQEFHDRQIEAMTTEMPGMRDILTRLRQRGYRLYGLSNWSCTIYPIIEKFSILRMLDDRIISCEERIVKPDPAIYRLLCSRFGLNPQDCLFTDDRQDNVDAARSVGMHALLFTDAHQFEQDLHALKVPL